MKQKIWTQVILLFAILGFLLISGCADNDARALSESNISSTRLDPIVINGSGRGFSQSFDLQEGLAIIKIRHMVGYSNAYFGIDLFEETEDNEEYVWKAKLLNKIYDDATSLNGAKAVNIARSGKYKLEIDAASEARWQLIIEQPRLTGQAMKLNELSGKSMQATEQFYLDEGTTEFRLKHDGSDKFIVTLLDDKGNNAVPLVDEKGYFDEVKKIDIPFADNYLLNVQADGAWEIYIQ